MAIWRGRTTAAVRRSDRMSERRDVVARGDELLDVLDLDPFRLAVAHEIADRDLGGLER